MHHVAKLICRRKHCFHVLPEGRKIEPGASGRKRNASLCPAEGRSLPGTTEKGWGKPTSAQAAVEAQRSLSHPSNTAQEHSQPLQRSPQQQHRDFQGVWYPGLNSTASQRSWGRQHSSSRGQQETQGCRLICTSTNKKWKCLPSRAMNSCNGICA